MLETSFFKTSLFLKKNRKKFRAPKNYETLDGKKFVDIGGRLNFSNFKQLNPKMGDFLRKSLFFKLFKSFSNFSQRGDFSEKV